MTIVFPKKKSRIASAMLKGVHSIPTVLKGRACHTTTSLDG